jgi:MoaA/NifB/PqqE/SkfB family radical SAM enzyme
MTEYTTLKLRGDETAPVRRQYATDPLTHPDVLYVIAHHDLDIAVAEGILDNPAADEILKQTVYERFADVFRYRKSVCPLLWNHISTFSNGDVRMCCEMIGESADYGKHRDDHGTALNVHDHRLEDIRNSSTVKRLRQQMLAGEKPDACAQCWHREELGMESKRNSSLIAYGHEITDYEKNTLPDGSIHSDLIPLRNLDLRFGNTCNLKCRTCGPADSNLWYEDYVKLNKQDDTGVNFWFYGEDKYRIISTDRGYRTNTERFEWNAGSDFYIDLLEQMPNVDTIYFTGGEPTVIKKHRQMLEYCIAKGYAANIKLDYNTNMHATPTYLGEYWRSFQQVNIGASIDGYGITQDYMRPPSTWDSVTRNILALDSLNIPHLHITISPTISIMNILNLIHLIDWVRNNDFNCVKPTVGNHTLYYPVEYTIQNLPDDVKQYVLAYYESWFNRLKESDPSLERSYRASIQPVLDYMMEGPGVGLHRFLEKTVILDKVRNEDWRTGLPDLYGVLTSYGYV